MILFYKGWYCLTLELFCTVFLLFRFTQIRCIFALVHYIHVDMHNTYRTAQHTQPNTARLQHTHQDTPTQCTHTHKYKHTCRNIEHTGRLHTSMALYLCLISGRILSTEKCIVQAHKS